MGHALRDYIERKKKNTGYMDLEIACSRMVSILERLLWGARNPFADQR